MSDYKTNETHVISEVLNKIFQLGFFGSPVLFYMFDKYGLLTGTIFKAILPYYLISLGFLMITYILWYFTNTAWFYYLKNKHDELYKVGRFYQGTTIATAMISITTLFVIFFKLAGVIVNIPLWFLIAIIGSCIFAFLSILNINLWKEKSEE